MKTQILPTASARDTSMAEQNLQHEDFENELIMDLERDQFVAETSRPLAPARLGTRARAGLLALRIFVVLLGIMVIYTFIEQLH